MRMLLEYSAIVVGVSENVSTVHYDGQIQSSKSDTTHLLTVNASEKG